jgi:light-regulated signal transduction histidine kinase (bacteriophytochrome)
MRNNHDEIIGFVMVTRDVTARREAAERIEKLNAELKNRAELLETANHELEAFSYSVSHDLRAPLRHIHGFVELLQKSPIFHEQEAAQRQMGVIARAAREMGLLIDDLLAFSRTGRAEMHLIPVDMNELVEQSRRALELETKGRRIAWEIKPLSKVEADPALLRLVWINLLGNAIKYTRPRAEATIEVGRRDAVPRSGGEPEEAVYYVRDNGVGFDMRYAAKLFGVFQRLHRAEDFEGRGIGLANVERIIHRHGGKVWAESKVDGGSTFYFSLPVKGSHQVYSYANGKN